MKPAPLFSLLVCSVLCLAPALASAGHVITGSAPEQVSTAPVGQVLLHSSSSSQGALAKAPTDTFTLYGGPGTNEGKFQDANGVIPQQQGWTGVDLTDSPPYWQVSSFNAELLNGHGPGNHAMWCGQTAAQQPGWFAGTGYGNNFDEKLLWESPPLANPGVGQTVTLDFAFLYDTEPGYDYFNVEYDSAGTWKNVLRLSGASRDTLWNQQPTSFAGQPSALPITFAGGDYGGDNGDQIRIQVHVRTDGAFSDQDGLYPTDAGAAQVDDISVLWSEGSNFEDFESSPYSWTPQQKPFVGDFSHVIPYFEDIDPCADNSSPQFAFIDDGQAVRNGRGCDSASIPGPDQLCSTGGTTSPTWDYGVSGGWVVNYTGGLSGGVKALDNQIWSPEIDWDLPGTADDGPDVVGAKVRFSMWNHLPLNNGIVATWKIRSSADGVSWSSWRRDAEWHVGDGDAHWSQVDWDVTGFLVANPVKIQIALGVRDVSPYAFDPNADATPSPTYDNVTIQKYRIGGPEMTALPQMLAMDGFPRSGTLDVSTSIGRDALDVSFGSAGDFRDSVVVTARAILPGSNVTDVRMFWILEKNPLFDDAIRAVPARAVDENVSTSPTTWSGEVLPTPTTDDWGFPSTDTFFFRLPRVDFFYPGDTIRYYFQASDDGGRVTTLPDDTGGFASGANYDRRFVVHALPAVGDASGSQPPKLAVVESSTPDAVQLVERSLGELGFVQGTDYDLFWVRGNSAVQMPGLAASGQHGATVTQLDAYDTILFSSENNAGAALGHAYPDDAIALLTTWHGLAGSRHAAWFGDDFASGVAGASAAGATFVHDVLGVAAPSPDVQPEIGGQTDSWLAPEGGFTTDLRLDGGCPDQNTFDSLRPLTGATRGHGYFDPTHTSVYPDPAASVVYDRSLGSDRKIDVTFAFGLGSLESPMHKAAAGVTAQAQLLQELFTLFGVGSGSGAPVAAPSAAELAMRVSPNPFNPRTTIRFEGLPTGADGTVRIYTVRGTLVHTLHDGPFLGSRFVWAGTDNAGQPVASGVYLIQAEVGEWRSVQKVALIR